MQTHWHSTGRDEMPAMFTLRLPHIYIRLSVFSSIDSHILVGAVCFESNGRLLHFTPSVVGVLEARVHTCCWDKCGENEGEASAKLNYPAKTITVMISIYTARSNEKRLEGKKDRSLLPSQCSTKEAFWLKLGAFMLKYSSINNAGIHWSTGNTQLAL